jgi:hypothetical protein
LLGTKGLDFGDVPVEAAGGDLDPNRHFHARFPSKREHGNMTKLPNP